MPGSFETHQVSLQAAPGLISTTADMWTVNTTKVAFLGVTAHWIELHTLTLDNASSNTMKCETIEATHVQRNLPSCCLGHVVNLAEVDVMTHITKIAAMEMVTAIWEYDPSLPDNCMLNSSLDIIAAIQTLTIKVGADHRYGPIRTIRHDGWVSKHILWSAFTLSKIDWERVLEACKILAISEKRPTQWQALPAIEELQTAWEAKPNNPRYVTYQTAISDGLAKLNKYYSRFDEKPAYILALVLHPYFKLAYIKLAWGGAEEQAAECQKGNRLAKNWQDEAQKILERMVSHALPSMFLP
ncbi:hypothetical protein L208DRAFT_1249650 [Tricholoma matsutake]|nr:hypothetical protein L208DRAFT_1249650 [Tricholoma matsutake 945]